MTSIQLLEVPRTSQIGTPLPPDGAHIEFHSNLTLRQLDEHLTVSCNNYLVFDQPWTHFSHVRIRRRVGRVLNAKLILQNYLFSIFGFGLYHYHKEKIFGEKYRSLLLSL